MIHSIRQLILKRMHYLEGIDARDLEDGIFRLQRLRQIPPSTGKFLALITARNATCHIQSGLMVRVDGKGGQ